MKKTVHPTSELPKKSAVKKAVIKEHTYAKITKDAPIEPEEILTDDHAEVLASPIASEFEETTSVSDAPESEVIETIPDRPRKHAFVLPIVLLIILIPVVLFALTRYQQMQGAKKNPSYAAEIKAKELIMKVGRLASLPAGENPTIAVVSDVQKLPKAPLFVDAQNGDEVLVYTTAHKAYVYRPSTDKIIAIGPITIASNNSQTTSSGSAAVTAPVKVMILNGTVTTGLARKAQAALAAKDPTASISGVSDAKTKDYKGTIVVDLSGKNAAAIKQIATIIGGTVSSLPKSESAPTNADILIILGSDYIGK